MSTIKNGGPAFPFQCQGTTTAPEFYYGMTLRDYFAAKALPGLMGRNWSSHTGTQEELIGIWASSAYGIADAMLRARESAEGAAAA